MPSPSRFQVLWAKTAAQDLVSILEYESFRDPRRAERSLAAIERASSRLTGFPKRGRIVPELKEQGIALYREMILPPWRIIYRSEGRSVLVLAVIDGRRNLEDLLLDRFLH